jgi:GT2 family glycosyltransferase
MTPRTPKVSVVIPNHNGMTERDGLVFLELVLSSLRRQTLGDFDITVVDDASTDGSVEYLEREWSEVRVVALAQNSGFPAVVNRGIDASDGEYVALLNTDVELSENWLEELSAALDSDPGLGFVGGKIMRYGEREVFEQIGLDFFTSGRFEPIGIDEQDSGQYDAGREIAAVTAAACMYRRSAVEAAGGFDEDYFLYCEDADLSLRMRLKGYRGRYVPTVSAFHVRGGTTGVLSERTGFYLTRNTLNTLLKDMPASLLIPALPKILVYQREQLRIARAHGTSLGRAWRSFLRDAPRTLRKRRRIQAGRRISPAEFASAVRTEYPLPTRFSRSPS